MSHFRVGVALFSLLGSSLAATVPTATRAAFEQGAFCKKYRCQLTTQYQPNPENRGYTYRLQGSGALKVSIVLRDKGGFFGVFLNADPAVPGTPGDLKGFLAKYRPQIEALTVGTLGVLPKLDLLSLCTKTFDAHTKVDAQKYYVSCAMNANQPSYGVMVTE